MKKISKIKRFLIIALIFLFSINSFATAVSDNDGSAFITKAEFDALKSSFQSQIDTFNQNIDSKIDNAIASYLSGIRMSKTISRSRLCDAKTWMMWPNNDYPTYVEGYPYVHGVCADGAWQKVTTGAWSVNNTWAGITLKGSDTYKTNGGYKKHFITSASNNVAKNGNSDYVAEYIGYYINEGEDISFGGWHYDTNNSYYALGGENEPKFTGANTFSPTTVPFNCYPNFQLYWTAKGYCTKLALQVQSAQRLEGIKNSGTNISIYNDISDNRFWDRDVQNKVGIYDTTPAIKKQLSGTDWCTWFDTVCPIKENVYASFRLQDYNATSKEWNPTKNSAFGAWSYTMVGTMVKDNTHIQSLCKLSNDGNNLQFKRLWTADTNAVASVLLDIINKPSTSIDRKTSIMKGLVYDENGTAHVTMGAGYPFLQVSKGEQVEWSFTVNGSNDCRLVAKYGPFDIDIDAESQADIEFTNITTGDKKVFIGKKGEDNTIRFNATEDGVIFLKWKSNTTTLAKTELNVGSDATVTLPEE